MYAILYELNSNAPDNAQSEIRRFLHQRGFLQHQGNFYFGEGSNAVSCMLTVQKMGQVLPWFAASVRDIRMLRIEEMNDLMPAIQQVSEQD